MNHLLIILALLLVTPLAKANDTEPQEPQQCSVTDLDRELAVEAEMLLPPCDPSKADTYNENRCTRCGYSWLPIEVYDPETGEVTTVGWYCQPNL